MKNTRLSARSSARFAHGGLLALTVVGLLSGAPRAGLADNTITITAPGSPASAPLLNGIATPLYYPDPFVVTLTPEYDQTLTDAGAFDLGFLLLAGGQYGAFNIGAYTSNQAAFDVTIDVNGTAHTYVAHGDLRGWLYTVADGTGYSYAYLNVASVTDDAGDVFTRRATAPNGTFAIRCNNVAYGSVKANVWLPARIPLPAPGLFGFGEVPQGYVKVHN